MNEIYFKEIECYKLKIPFIVLHQHILKQTENKWIHSMGCISTKVTFIQSAQLFNHTKLCYSAGEAEEG